MLIELAYGRPSFSDPLTDDKDGLSDLEEDYAYLSISRKEKRRLCKQKTDVNTIAAWPVIFLLFQVSLQIAHHLFHKVRCCR